MKQDEIKAVRCSECGRVYYDLQAGMDCPDDSCPSNNETPKHGTLEEMKSPKRKER